MAMRVRGTRYERRPTSTSRRSVPPRGSSRGSRARGAAEQGDRRRQRVRPRGRHPPGRDAQGRATYQIIDPGELGLRDDAAARQALGAPRLLPRLRGGRSRARRGELVVAFARFKARADAGGAVSIDELFQEVTLRDAVIDRLSRGRRDRARGDGPGEPWRSRAAARLHGFELEEQHVPFGADATMRSDIRSRSRRGATALAADADSRRDHRPERSCRRWKASSTSEPR